MKRNLIGALFHGNRHHSADRSQFFRHILSVYFTFPIFVIRNRNKYRSGFGIFHRKRRTAVFLLQLRYLHSLVFQRICGLFQQRIIQRSQMQIRYGCICRKLNRDRFIFKCAEADQSVTEIAWILFIFIVIRSRNFNRSAIDINCHRILSRIRSIKVQYLRIFSDRQRRCSILNLPADICDQRLFLSGDSAEQIILCRKFIIRSLQRLKIALNSKRKLKFHFVQ